MKRTLLQTILLGAMMLLTTNLQANSTDLSTMDNVIYVKPQSAEVGTEATLSFMMKNTAGIHDFQFDLYLPEGVTAVKDSKGRFIALLNSGRLPVDDEHLLTLSEEGDGAIRFQCSSLYEEVFTGNEGEILTMKVSIAETMTNGDYPIVLKNMRLCETDISKYYDVDYVETTLTVRAKNQTTTFTFEDSNNPFTDARRITSAIEDDATLGSKVLGWTCASNATNGYSFSHYDFTSLLEKSALVKLEFDYYNTMGGRSVLTIGDALVRGTTGGSSKITYNKTGAVFRIGSDKNNAYINDIVFGQDDLCDKWLHVVVTVNPDARTVAWVVTDQGGNEISSGSDNFYADDANACTQIDVFGYINNSHCAMMDNLTITNYKSNAAFADYTVRYVDPNGNEIKESRMGNGQVGKYAKLMDSDKEPVYANDYEGNPMKFVYESDNSETTPIAAEGTVITVTFREAEKWYAVLNCKAGGETIKQLRDDSKYWFFEGDNLTLYPSRGYSKDGKYYMTDATNNWNGVEYTFPGSISPTVSGGKTYYIGTLYYQLDTSVAYYANFEDLALPVVDAGEGTGLGQLVGSVNNWWSFSNGYFPRFSGGRGIRLDANSYVWTEPIAEDGTYMVRIYGRNDKSANCKKPYALGYRDAEGKVTLFDVAVPDWGSATTGESIVGSVEEASGIGIKAGWSLVIMNTGNGDMISLDDIKLTKVAGYTETPILLVYTEFVEETGTLTYFYDGQREKRTGVTELYDPVGNPDAVRFTGYYKKVKKAVIDPSMKDAPLTSMYSMFFGGINGETFAFQVLSNMTEIKGMDNLNTADVTRMDWMFEACNSLQTIDVSSFDVSKVTKMDYMFGDCYKLTTIYCNDDWSNTSASSFYMFATCTSLVGGKGTTFDSEVKDKTYARPDGGTESPGYFTEKPSLQGDLNGDGKVDIADAVTVLNIMAAGEYNASADLNGDGKNDIADFVTILNIMAAQ